MCSTAREHPRVHFYLISHIFTLFSYGLERQSTNVYADTILLRREDHRKGSTSTATDHQTQAHLFSIFIGQIRHISWKFDQMFLIILLMLLTSLYHTNNLLVKKKNIQTISIDSPTHILNRSTHVWPLD